MPNFQPDQYSTVTPYIVASDLSSLIDFIVNVFDGKIAESLQDDNGNSVHAEVVIGDSTIMLGATDDMSGAVPGMLYVYVPDTDATYNLAIELGATSLEEPDDKFYGDRNAGVRDKWGNMWYIATRVEDVEPEELERRAKEMMGE